MFMQSNLGAYEVRRDEQTNQVSIEPITHDEYYSRTTEQYSSVEYDDYIYDLLDNLTYDINTYVKPVFTTRKFYSKTQSFFRKF